MKPSCNALLIPFNKRYFILFENSTYYINDNLVQIFVPMVRYEAYIGSKLPTFRETYLFHLEGSDSLLALEDWTDSLSRNVCK